MNDVHGDELGVVAVGREGDFRRAWTGGRGGVRSGNVSVRIHGRGGLAARTVWCGYGCGGVDAAREGSSQRRGCRTHEAWASVALAGLDSSCTRCAHMSACTVATSTVNCSNTSHGYVCLSFSSAALHMIHRRPRMTLPVPPRHHETCDRRGRPVFGPSRMP